MIEWFCYVLVAVALVVGVGCLVLGLVGRAPSDYTIGATGLVELLLMIQVVIAAISPLVGNVPTGSAIEFWVYLGSAILIPPAAVVWALIERNRWSTVVLGVACLAVAVMGYRMAQIWFVQLA